jgi:hypothetical protein
MCSEMLLWVRILASPFISLQRRHGSETQTEDNGHAQSSLDSMKHLIVDVE